MKGFSKMLRLGCLVAALLTAHAFAVSAQSPSTDQLVVRWVMAGVEKDADPSRPISISPAATLRTGDKIKMYLNAVNKCFFYLFYQNPEGQLQLIYPDSLPAEALASGTRLTVPPGDQWFELDDQTGMETFHVLVSPTPLTSIETLYEDYRQQASDNGDSAVRIVSAIERLHNQQRPLTSKAERPLPIGGTIRGAFDKDTEATEIHLEHLAENIVTSNFFCRTYKIEHH